MKKLLIFLGLGLGVYALIKRKTDAFESTTIKLAGFKVNQLAYPNLLCTLTVAITNPTNEKLTFDSISGTAIMEGTTLSTFDNTIGAVINANGTTSVPVEVSINLKSLWSTFIKFINAQFKGMLLIDSITTVAGVKIPVRQVFPIDFAGLGKQSNNTPVDIKLTPLGVTPTLVQPDILSANGIPAGYVAVSSNANGNIDATGGAVITITKTDNPATIQTDFEVVQTPDTQNGRLLVINPDSIPVQSFPIA
jgi:LEA14-like dessication related protein